MGSKRRGNMDVFYGVDDIGEGCRGAALAIGNFDGVHRGHQALLAKAREEAEALNGPAGVMIFEPHPREFFAPDKAHFRLTTLEQKLGLLKSNGMDLAVVLSFNAGLAGLDAEAFVTELLVGRLGVRHVVIGYDFFFGKGRGGNADLMAKMGKGHGFGVSVIQPVAAAAGEVFSSSAIRALLGQGRVKDAADMLGHWWRVAGKVSGGARRGTELGFPTANITLAPSTALAHGIYAVRVSAGGARHLGAGYLGTRPTFDDGAPVLEIFLFDFDGDLYGAEIEVEFIDHIRADQRFADAAALKEQMAADCANARKILAATDDADPYPRRD